MRSKNTLHPIAQRRLIRAQIDKSGNAKGVDMHALLRRKWRLAICAPFAAGASVGLLFIMAYLVERPNGVLEEDKTHRIALARPDRNEDVRHKDRSRPKPPERITPPSAMSGRLDKIAQAPRLAAMKTTHPEFEFRRLDLAMNIGEFDIQPEFRVPPFYPIKAQQRGTQGFVKLCFDVDAEGRPINIEVVDFLPNDVFNKSATAAVSQWRYPAKTENGVKVVRHGVCAEVIYRLGGS